ncbi:hypothetical protein [Nocardioides sp. LHG3406-4]|uniref:hypothetical protein n=1 Tax=Nocardioides sp. LHG3406-4 TaxID=2804575 RepID=UPI003CF530B1
MAVVHRIPDELLHGPFSRTTALAAGIPARVLEGTRFVRVHPRVYRHRDHRLSDEEHVTAAALALPTEARTTGITRLQQLGLDYGPHSPVRFVVTGDLHLAMEGVMLHRTVLMPPTDDVGVVPAAAYLAYCAEARVLDAIKVGDWLLHHGHTTLDSIAALATGQLWRRGAMETLWILPHLNGRSRSLRESEVRAVLTFADLPDPELNVPVDLTGELAILADLWFARWGVAVEYEGGHHQEDRAQYSSDIDRYAVMRRHQVRYVQVTREKLGRPRTVVAEVYRELLSGGYDGPPPEVGRRWRSLFGRVPVSSRRFRSVS